MKTIAIFGGSFDPIHNAHINIAKEVHEQLNVDVYFMLSTQARWKITNTTTEDRINMINLAIKDYSYLHLETFEIDLNRTINFTYDTMSEYLASRSNTKVYYIIGGDQLEKLHEWGNIDELSKMVQFVYVNRPNVAVNNENLKKYNVITLEINALDISSTKVREGDTNLVPESVRNYMNTHFLYLEDRLRLHLSEDRYEHSLSVANLARQIAIRNNENPLIAYVSGLMHDCAKQLPDEESLELMKKYFKEELEYVSEKVYHQFLAPYVLKTLYSIDNEIINEAIQYHTTGRVGMSKLAKIIYVADKLDPLRGYDSTKMIKICEEDINKGFVITVKQNYDYLKSKNIVMNKSNKEFFKEYLGE